MEIFNSKIALIHYFEDIRLIKISWKQCDAAEDFMPVMSQVRDFYEILMPRKALWNQSLFNFNIPPNLQQWTVDNINLPTQRLNIVEKISFVVSKDTLSQMSVMKIFDDSSPEPMPRYFIAEAESLQWLNEPMKKDPSAKTAPPQIIIDRKRDKIRLSVEIESEEFNEYLYLFSKLWETKTLSLDMAERFMALSLRERTIVRLLVKGKSNDFISEVLSISPHTMKTHRKNIYKKLGCNRIEDLMRYIIVV